MGLPARELPGTPALMAPGAEPIGALASASDKVHLYARPQGTDSGAAIADDRWYATYFRLAMGFGTSQGKARVGALRTRRTSSEERPLPGAWCSATSRAR